jgi:quinol monooxygenase YgiN
MTTLLVHIKIRAGREREFEAAARRMYEASHAGEAGLRRYEYWRGQEPGTYYTLEAFDDYNGFLRHQASGHHEGETNVFRETIESIRLEWVDALADASPLAPTVAVPLPPDADDTMTAYASRQPLEVAAWWAPLRDA